MGERYRFGNPPPAAVLYRRQRAEERLERAGWNRRKALKRPVGVDCIGVPIYPKGSSSGAKQ